jgi:hypothetical protein
LVGEYREINTDEILHSVQNDTKKRGAGYLLQGELGVSPSLSKIPPRMGDTGG